MTVSTIISYAIYGLVGVLVLFGALLGFIRGVRRQTIRFITIIASIAISFVLCTQIYPMLISSVGEYNVAELMIGAGIEMDEAYVNLLACVDASLAAYILALPLGIIIIPVFFVVAFFLISAILLILHKILSGIFGFTRRNNNALTRLLGMLMGALQGVIVAAVFLIPVAGVVDTVGTAIDNTEQNHPDNEMVASLSSLYDEYLGEAESSPVLFAVKQGGGFIYEAFYNLEIDGEKTDVTEVVDIALEIYVNYGDLAAANWSALNESEKAAITQIVDTAVENKYTAVILSGVLSSIGEAFDREAISLNYEEPLLSFINTFVEIIATSDKTNLSADINTAKNVYFILSDSGALVAATENPNGLIDVFLDRSEGDSSVFSRLLGTISENPRMEPIVKQMSSLAVSMLIQNSEIDKDTIAIIDDVKGGINEVLAIDKNTYATEEEYKAAVSESIGTTLADNGIELPAEQVDEISDFVIEEFEGKEEITDADLAEFMAKYYDIYKNDIDQLPDNVDGLPIE